MAEPRPSTDQENAPLLVNTDEEQQQAQPRGTLWEPSRPLTALEKVLAVIAILLLLLTTTFVGLFAGTERALRRERHNRHHAPAVTTTVVPPTTTTTSTVTTTVINPAPTGTPPKDPSHCVIAAASIIKYMNASADPCDDFYRFAVGGWLESTTIPADRGLTGSFYELADQNKKLLTKVIEGIPDKLVDESDEAANLYKLKSVYNSCMDTDLLDEVGLEPLLPLVRFVTDNFGEFDLNPLPKDGDEDDDDTPDDKRRRSLREFDDEYTIPETLRAAAERVSDLREAKRHGVFPPFNGHKPEGNNLPFDFGDSLDDGLPDDGDTEQRRQKLTAAVAYLHSIGIDALFQFAIEGDAGGDDPQIQSLWFYQAFGGLPAKQYYDEAPIVNLYTSVIQNMLMTIGKATEKSPKKGKRDLLSDLIGQAAGEQFVAAAEATDDDDSWPWPWPGDEPGPMESRGARMTRLAEKVVAFEQKLVQAGADPEFLFNPSYAYNPYPSKKFADRLPIIDFPAYLATFAPRLYPANITVTYPPYLQSISNLVAKTPDHVLSAYFVTKIAIAYAPLLGPNVAVRSQKRRLEELLQGIKPGTPENRQDVCLRRVDDAVGFIAGREFVREAFSPEAKADGEGIINSVVTAFSKRLPSIKWMDEESAAAARKKANAIIPKVGYPLYPDTMDPKSINSYYSRLKIDSKDFFGNLLRAEQWSTSRSWGALGRQRNRNSWEMFPQTVNAYYSPPDGEIVFPAGILQPPFYSYEWPSYLSYGAFGAVAAHELTHAFDNSGAQYDERGRLRDWWTNKTVAAFQERAQCVARQYSEYYVLDDQGRKVYVNGNLTNGEDIADSGIAQAFRAWTDKADGVEGASSSERQKLPGLEYTPEQLFFISFARVWAQLARPATAVARVRTDPHSPPYWRAVGTLRNLPAFHEAFQCKKGSGMNPKAQCELW